MWTNSECETKLKLLWTWEKWWVKWNLDDKILLFYHLSLVKRMVPLNLMFITCSTFLRHCLLRRVRAIACTYSPLPCLIWAIYHSPYILQLCGSQHYLYHSLTTLLILRSPGELTFYFNSPENLKDNVCIREVGQPDKRLITSCVLIIFTGIIITLHMSQLKCYSLIFVWGAKAD